MAALLFSFIPQAHASFVAPYSMNQFALTNTESDGTAQSLNSGATLVITGPNDGSGNPGTTDLTIHAPASGVVTFHWSYSSLDTPGFDDAGYLLGGVFTLLADTDGETGSASFAVTQGETFGFEMDSADNMGEPGILTISNFAAPLPATSVPEPAPVFLLAASAAVVAAYRFARRSAWRESK